MVDQTKCPNCGSGNTYRRKGVHFDHERRCAACGEDYDPDEAYPPPEVVETIFGTFVVGGEAGEAS